MRRIEASRRNASALRLRFSQSLASLRQRLSQAKVRSTTERRGRAAAVSALASLAVARGGGRAGFSFALLTTRNIKRVMDGIQRAVVAPQVEIVEKCAARRQIFRDRTPLASRAQNVHDPVHHFAHLDMKSGDLIREGHHRCGRRRSYDRSKLRYPSDLTDDEWAHVEP